MNQKNLNRLIDSVERVGYNEDMSELLQALRALDETTSMTPEGQALIAEALDICLI